MLFPKSYISRSYTLLLRFIVSSTLLVIYFCTYFFAKASTEELFARFAPFGEYSEGSCSISISGEDWSVNGNNLYAKVGSEIRLYVNARGIYGDGSDSYTIIIAPKDEIESCLIEAASIVNYIDAPMRMANDCLVISQTLQDVVSDVGAFSMIGGTNVSLLTDKPYELDFCIYIERWNTSYHSKTEPIETHLKEYTLTIFDSTSNLPKDEDDSSYKSTSSTETQSDLCNNPTLMDYIVYPTAVEMGNSYSISGKINGNGNKIIAVSVAIRNAVNEELGGYWGHEKNLNVDTFDLSSFGKLKAGDKIGNTTLEPGEYIVQVYVTTDTGLTFEKEQKTTVTVKEKAAEHPTLTNFKVSPSTAEEGENFSLSGKINGNGNKITAVSVGVRNAANEALGGYWGEKKNISKSSFDLSTFGKLKAGEKIGNTTLTPGDYIVQVYVTTDSGLSFKKEHKITITIEEKEPVVIGVPKWQDEKKEITSAEDDVYLYYHVDDGAEYVLLEYEGCDKNDEAFEKASLGVYPVKKRFGYVLPQYKDYPYGFKDEPFSQFTAPISKLYLTVCDENEKPLSETSSPLFIHRTDLLTDSELSTPEWLEASHDIYSINDPIEMIFQAGEKTEYISLLYEEYDETGTLINSEWDSKKYPAYRLDAQTFTLGEPFTGFAAATTKVYMMACDASGNRLSANSAPMTVSLKEHVSDGSYNELLTGSSVTVASLGNAGTIVNDEKNSNSAYYIDYAINGVWMNNRSSAASIAVSLGDMLLVNAYSAEGSDVQPSDNNSYFYGYIDNSLFVTNTTRFVTLNKPGTDTICLFSNESPDKPLATLTVTVKNSIYYKGCYYDIEIPAFDFATKSNAAEIDGWKTIDTLVLANHITFDWAGFLSGIDLEGPVSSEDALESGQTYIQIPKFTASGGMVKMTTGSSSWSRSGLALGIQLLRDIIANHHATKIRILLQQNGNAKRAVIELGNESIPNRANMSRRSLTLAITESYTWWGASKKADEMIRKIWPNDGTLLSDYIYNMFLAYDKEWSHDFYYAYIHQDNTGEWNMMIKIKPGDEISVIGSPGWFTNKKIHTIDIKEYLLTPIQLDEALTTLLVDAMDNYF